MNLTLHLVRSDLVRMRVWIACWAGVLLVPIAAGAMLLTRSPFHSEQWTLPDTLSILTGVELVVGYILTILLIHEHPVLGTTQFWVTRPISRWRLLAAKALAAFAIVGLVPVIVSLPWWLWCGFGLREIAGATVEMLVVLSMVIVCGVLMASLTESIGRALLWTFAFVAVGLFAMFFFAGANMPRDRTSHEISLMLTRSSVAVIAILLEFVAVIVLQFLLRRRGWWLGVAGAAIIATLFWSLATPWSWFDESEPREINPSRADGVTIRIQQAQAEPTRPGRANPLHPLQVVEVSGVLAGVSPDLNVMGVGARQRWTLPGGLHVERESSIRTLNAWYDTRDGDEVRFSARAGIPRSIVARLAAEESHYEARLWFRLGRLERWFETPLASGESHRHDGNLIRIERGSSEPDNLRVEFVHTSAQRIRDRLRLEVLLRSWFAPLFEYPVFLAVDHAQQRFVWLSGRVRQAVIHGVAITWHDAAPLRSGTRSAWSRLPDAVSSSERGVTFTVASWRTEAQFARNVKVERLQVER